MDDVFKLLDLFLANTTQLVTELSVFIDELLNDIHLLIQLGELGVCEDLSIRKFLVKRTNLPSKPLDLAWLLGRSLSRENTLGTSG